MADELSQSYNIELTINLQDAISEGKVISVAFEKCPLCSENRAFLLCDYCVNSGQFTHTQRRDSGNFQQRKQEWLQKKKERDDTVKNFEQEIADIERKDAKRSDIEKVKKKIYLLKKAILDSKSSCTTEKIQLTKRQRRNRRNESDQSHKLALNDIKQKICNLQEGPNHPLPSLHDLLQLESRKDHAFFYLFTLAREKLRPVSETALRPKDGTSTDQQSVPNLKCVLNLCHQYLAFQRSQFIRCLSARIFPIQEVYAISEPDNLEMSTATALKDACETAFIGGRWVHTDHRGENHCQIVASTLPDYVGETCAVNLFVSVMASLHGSDKPNEIPVGNPSYGIVSSIAYTSLFVHLMSVILDVNLPRKCSFRELRDDMTESDFSNFVWRLHQNIMHLAYSQKVDPHLLVDNLSLQNVLSILKYPKLGRVGPFSPKFEMPVIAELCPFEYESVNDVSMTELDLTRDWERVPSGIPTYESSTMPLGMSSPLDYNTSTAGAFITNAAASLAGWWRSYYNK